MTTPELQTNIPKDKDEEIRHLKLLIESYKKESAWHESQTEIAGKAAASFISITEQSIVAFSLLADSFTKLSKASSECSSNINKHYISHRQQNTFFDPDFVRLQVAAMTDALSSSTESMSAAVEKIVQTVESAKQAQKFLAEAAETFKENNE